MHKYEIIIYWSDEDGLYIAEAPDLPGCVTHGETYNAALSNVEEAIQLWVDTAKEFNNPIPKPRGKKTGRRPTESTFKGQSKAVRSPVRRRNNPRVTFSAGRTAARVNPKVH